MSDEMPTADDFRALVGEHGGEVLTHAALRYLFPAIAHGLSTLPAPIS